MEIGGKKYIVKNKVRATVSISVALLMCLIMFMGLYGFAIWIFTCLY